MKDEIKEIIYLEKYVDKYKSDEKSIINGNRLTTPAMLDYLEVKALLDYITNLQTIEREYSAILSENAELENKITNLQEENKELQTANEYHQNIIQEYETMKSPNHLYGENVYLRGREASLHKQFQDYKTRIDKAIEYIEKGNKHFKENYNEPYEYAFMVNADEIMKILQGKSDE